MSLYLAVTCELLVWECSQVFSTNLQNLEMLNCTLPHWVPDKLLALVVSKGAGHRWDIWALGEEEKTEGSGSKKCPNVGSFWKYLALTTKPQSFATTQEIIFLTHQEVNLILQDMKIELIPSQPMQFYPQKAGMKAEVEQSAPLQSKHYMRAGQTAPQIVLHMAAKVSLGYEWPQEISRVRWKEIICTLPPQ
ncbi:hypothetical protein F5141DRAFT_1064964 [Pisolithus sp. B1]|nr:hypothetical protein F5141DRAFT_1064964 [Pisolithus sp. B1]